jgi:4-hydroxyphenylacetate 3-monooxygenase
MRSGDHYLASLRDGRAVFLDGERVDDVTKHPAFAEPIRRVAQTFDLARAADVQEATTYVDAASGRRHSAMWLVPRSAEDLGRRRRVHRLWAEPSFGLMGRTPDHVACVLSAFAGWRQLFDRGGARFGDNVVRFHARARDEDLYVAYGIVPLQIDRSQPAHRQPEPFLYPGVVAERDGGIVVRGSQGITTAAVLADWLFISYITPLVAGDEAYALSFVVPGSAPGLRIHPRRPYARRPPASSTTRCPRASTRWTPPWCSTTCSCPGSRCSSIATWSWSTRSSTSRPPTRWRTSSRWSASP